jgi:tetratricopeptide (TPR) repeat protein
MPLSSSDLGARLAALQDESRRETFDFARARARLLRAYPGREAKPRLGVRWVLAAVVAAACCVGIALVRRPAALEFRIGAAAVAAQAGDWIAPAPQERLPIHFSDGTELELSGGARARILDIDATGATVIVERGELHASVAHRNRARWRVFIGPFRVYVTGTRFDVAWRPEDERFSLALQAGSVLVSGPGIHGERPLRAGERLLVGRVGGALTELASEPPPPRSLPASSVAETEQAAPAPARSTTPTHSAEQRGASAARQAAAPRAPLARSDDFRALASTSRYPEALAAAERAGFTHLCQTLALSDLLLLADVARLAGAPGLARLAYRSARERFAGRDDGQAAFFLGRLAFDRDGDYAEAARLFERSLAEGPGGPLAREAAGRLLEARIRLGDEAGARRAAREYLERFPSGPYAAVARRWAGAP